MFESELDHLVKISFRMQVGNLIDSTMVQLYPVSFAVEMCEKFKENQDKMLDFV